MESLQDAVPILGEVDHARLAAVVEFGEKFKDQIDEHNESGALIQDTNDVESKSDFEGIMMMNEAIWLRKVKWMKKKMEESDRKFTQEDLNALMDGHPMKSAAEFTAMLNHVWNEGEKAKKEIRDYEQNALALADKGDASTETPKAEMMKPKLWLTEEERKLMLEDGVFRGKRTAEMNRITAMKMAKEKRSTEGEMAMLAQIAASNASGSGETMSAPIDEQQFSQEDLQMM